MSASLPAADWHPGSWQNCPRVQMPKYRDQAALETTLAQLQALPPLVTSWEVENLKQELAEIADGSRFLLQGGDCAENFAECRSEMIAGKLKILLQMSLILLHGSKKNVTRVGRFAGQYAKPRSSDQETRGEDSLPSYRGDLVNAIGFTPAEREPDPQRLLTGYYNAALTLNFIRSLIDGGFADLHHPEYWQLDFVRHSDKQNEYDALVREISESVDFLETISGQSIAHFNRVEFFTSHEGLHLDYEQAQTRQVPHREGWYNLSTHLPWIGNRTRSLAGAHVEFFRGIQNPIGVKVDGKISADELSALVKTLNHKNEPGRLTLIHRLGEANVASELPKLIETVARSGIKVIWCCDPMHGNTETTDNGYKTRDFKRILSELEQSFDIHQAMGSYLGGVHFELTGEDVTECTGGARGLTSEDLARDYRSQVDPRLNYEQALEMAMLIAQHMRK